MTNLQKAHFFSIFLGLFVIVFDQASKWSVLAFLERGSVVEVCKYVNIILSYNLGTSFGLLSPATETQRCLIIVLSVLCISFLIYVFCKLRVITEKVLCGALIGGAISNLIDRFIHGGVVDFVDAHYEGWHWPAFNVADSVISLSAIFLIITSLRR